MALLEAFLEILERPAIGGISIELMTFLAPVWVAFLVGVIVGWAWKPRWGSFLDNGKFDFSAPSSPSASSSPPIKALSSTQSFSSCQAQTPSLASSALDKGANKEQSPLPPIKSVDCSLSQLKKEDSLAVMEDDLQHLCHLVERTDGGPAWKHMMDRSTPSMSYQAWQRDVENGPPQYCSRTVYEDATPELMRDFFWDDEFRLEWDDMLLHSATTEECPTTGTMVVHWVRKFPFFCSDREYTIGRRIWESGRSYYCVTKGVPCPSVPRREKPRRVDLYYSSWFIQAVESRKGNGQLNACEVILFHHEDMGIPWEIAKFGVRQGMWGAVKKIERGFRAYQKARASDGQISRSAFMAQINTKVNPDYLKSLGDTDDTSETKIVDSPEKPGGAKLPKVLILGGAIALACSLDRGLLTKAVIFGVARKFANIGRRF